MFTPTSELTYNPNLKVWRLPIDVLYGAILHPETPKTPFSEALLNKLEGWYEYGVLAITDRQALPKDNDAYVLAFTPVKYALGDGTLLNHLSIVNTAQGITTPFKDITLDLTPQVITDVVANLVDYEHALIEHKTNTLL